MRSHDDRQTVIAMSRAGQSIRQIGRTLKMSPKTIRRILDGTAADHIQRPSRYQDLIPLIRELFVRFDGNVVSIQKELACQYGHNIPYTSLTHLVRNENLRPEKTKRSGTFLYLPGREAQHDTSAHYIENSLLPGQAFKDWQTLNDAVRSWCDTVANNKIKRALAMTARQAWQSEKPLWYDLFANKALVDALLDRLKHRCVTIKIDGKSLRAPQPPQQP